MSDRIVVLDGYTTNPGDLDWSPLAALGTLEVFDRTPEALVAERVGDAPHVLLNKAPLTGEIIAALPALRYVGVLATGYNTVDLASAKARGITVTNTPAYASVSVAQHAAAMMLDLARKLTAHANAVRAGDWSRSPDWCLPLGPIFELTGPHARAGRAWARSGSSWRGSPRRSACASSPTIRPSRRPSGWAAWRWRRSAWRR